MIKLPIDKTVATALDKVIADYKFPGRLCGKPAEILLEGKDLPSKDVPHANDMYCFVIPSKDDKVIEAAAAKIWPDKKLVNLSGRFHYTEKGFMGWHTNSNQPGWRLYATFCKEDEKSFFRYRQDGKIHTEWEKKGWNFRGFEVKKNDPYWHCVYSDTDRYSFGFRFVELRK